ncbi:hypothetical protein NSND_62385 [Nitrospira sp. ND1]|nr:hypothetical protein NSND_62385 [Nitrospira sp. ND1]
MFQFLQPLYVGGFQAAVLGLPLVVRGGIDAVVPPDLIDGTTGIGLFQGRHNLRFGELRLTHGNLLARVAIVPESSPNDCLDLRAAYSSIKLLLGSLGKMRLGELQRRRS